MSQTENTASHLSPAVRASLELTAEERIQRVRSPRWIGYPMAKRILDRLEDLLTYPQTHRMPGLLLVGETNNGKTMIINRFKRLHPADDNPEGETIHLPVLIVQAPPTPSEGRLYDNIMEKVACPFRQTTRLAESSFRSSRSCAVLVCAC